MRSDVGTEKDRGEVKEVKVRVPKAQSAIGVRMEALYDGYYS